MKISILSLWHALKLRDVFWPTVFVVPALAVLLSLGAWQWQRKNWKEGLLRQLELSTTAEPAALSTLLSVPEPDALRFRRGRLAGRFLHDKEIHIWSPGQQKAGWRVVTPFELEPSAGSDAAVTPSHILVIRGNVDDAHKTYATRPERPALQPFEVVGRVRFDSVNWATPEPDLKANRWYALQNGRMAEVLRQALPRAKIAPFFIEAEVAAATRPAPQPDLRQLTLRNRHLEYAVTWWGLALTLVCVYAAFISGRLRQA